MKPQNQKNKSNRLKDLEREKLLLEIGELNKKWYGKLNYGIIISIISGLFALATIIWTMSSGLLNTK